jgi:predicted phosphodiesterase
MKTLVFSDSHLARRFDEKQFAFLKKIILKSDRVVINGDFWDGYLTSFRDFINSSWKYLFPILKSKNAIYVYGNHDKRRFASSKVSLFSDVYTARYQEKFNGKTLIFEHGNNLLPALDDRYQVIIPRFVQTGVSFTHDFMARRFGNKFLKFAFKSSNRILKRKLKKRLAPDEIFICGHTHCAEVDLKNNFGNSGIVKAGLGQYLIIDNKDQVILKEEKYC